MAANIPAKGSNLSRFELINFVNRTLAGHLDIHLLHVEQLSTGAAYCQMMAKLFPNSVALHRVKNKTKLEREWISNFKILEASFKKMSVTKEIPIYKLIKGRLQDNLEFLQWFKRFYDANSKDATKDSAPAGSRTYRRSAKPPKGPGNYKGNSNAPPAREGATKGSALIGASRPRHATDSSKHPGNYKADTNNAPTAPKDAPKQSAPPKRPATYKGSKSNAPPASKGASKEPAPVGASRPRRATDPPKPSGNYKGKASNAPPKAAPKESATGGSRTYRRYSGPPKTVPKADRLQKKSENTGIVPPKKKSNVSRRATPKPTKKAGGDTLPSIPPGTIEALIDERDFFYSKLRDIEIICHHSADNGRVPEDIYKPVQDVLYHCREGFAPPKPSTSTEGNKEEEGTKEEE